MRIREIMLEAEPAAPSHAPQYKTLADKYPVGNTQIWYSRSADTNAEADPHNLSATHVLVGRVQETDPEKIYAMMQGEVLSPQGEAGHLLRQLNLHHTSMTKGDIIKDGDKILVVGDDGFTDLANGGEPA